MSRKPPDDPIRAFAREAVAARRVGEDAKCACGEARPLALIAGSSPIICAKCDRRKRGKSEIDRHHIAGKRNSSIVILVDVNDHRALLSAWQYRWPKNTLQNPKGNPMLKIAALMRGYFDEERRLEQRREYLREEILAEVAELENSESESSDTDEGRR